MYYQPTVSSLDLALICYGDDENSVNDTINAVNQLHNFNSTIDFNRQGNWSSKISAPVVNQIKYRVICENDLTAGQMPPKTPVKVTKGDINIDFTHPEKVKIFSEEMEGQDVVAYSLNVCVPQKSKKISYVNYNNAKERLYLMEHVEKFIKKHQSKGRTLQK